MTGILLGLILGCAGPRSDAELYSEALARTETFEQADGLCRRIVDDDGRGDCLMAIFERYDRLQPSDCGSIDMGIWRDECMFQLAERQRAAGELATAIQTCHENRFGRNCAWHLLQDEAEASLDDAPVDAEKRIAPFSASRRLPDAGRQFWTIRFRELGARGTTLDEALCDGLAEPSSCREAVAVHVRTILDATGRTNRARTCAAAPGRRATIKGNPAWLAGPVTLAAEADWVGRWCGENAGAPIPRPG